MVTIAGQNISAPLIVGALVVGSTLGVFKGGFGLGAKGKKIFDITKGVIGDFALGMGGGAIMNKLDNVITGGQLQNFNSSMVGLGTPNKGQNINGTDLLVMATTVGFGISKNTLRRFAPFFAGKKVGEFTGAIDPATPAAGQTILSANSGVRTR